MIWFEFGKSILWTTHRVHDLFMIVFGTAELNRNGFANAWSRWSGQPQGMESAGARARECTLHARNNIYFIVFAFLGSVCRIGPTDIEQTITPAMNADGGNSTLVATAANILENTCDDVNERMVPTFSMESRIWLQLQWATGWRRWSRKGIGEYGEKS